MEASVLKKRIQESGLKEDGKLKLIEACDVLGQGGLFVLNQGLNFAGTDQYEAGARFKFILAFSTALREFKNGDPRPLSTLLHDSLEQPELEFGKIVLPVIADIRAMASLAKIQLPGDMLTEFESKLFRHLPKDELAVILSSNLLVYERIIDVLGELRKAYLFAAPEYDGGLWTEDLLPLLRSNTEEFGTKMLALDGKEVKPSIKNWIQDYELFTKKSADQRGAYDEIHYIDTAPNVRGLAKEDKTVLLSILRLHEWLIDPYVALEDAQALGLAALIESKGSETAVDRNPVPGPRSTPAQQPTSNAQVPPGPVVPKPPGFKMPSVTPSTPKRVEPVSVKPAQSITPPSRVVPVMQKDSSPKQVIPEKPAPAKIPEPRVRDVNIQEMLKKDAPSTADLLKPPPKLVDVPVAVGVNVNSSHVDTGFQKIKQHMEAAKPTPPAVDIQKKLEALRKKSEGNS